MLEGILESLLLNHLQLGEWIENLDRSKLKLDIWSGSISLKSLTLKHGALDRFGYLPFKIEYGHIEELQIHIPWNAMQSQSVKIIVKGVYVLLQTKQDGDDEQRESTSSIDSVQRAQHRSQIDEAEHLRQLAKNSTDSAAGQAEKGFMENLISTILANIQVTVEKIHIRIEHAQKRTRQTKPTLRFSEDREEEEEAAAAPVPLAFAAGLSISSLSALTISNTTGQPEFALGADVKKTKIRKQLKIADLALYANPGARSWTNLNPAALRITFSNGIARTQEADPQWWLNNSLKSSLHRCSFLLLPLEVELDLQLNRVDKTKPYVTVNLHLPILPLAMNDSQLRVLGEFAEDATSSRLRKRETLHHVIRSCDTSKPKEPPLSRQAMVFSPNAAASSAPPTISPAKAWWRWSFQCLQLLAHHARPHLGILERAKVFREYLPLWKRTLGASWLSELSESEQQRLMELEFKLSTSSIMLFRSIGEKELEQEAKNRDSLLELEKAANAKRGYVASWYGYLSGADAAKSVASKKIDKSASASASSSAASSPVGFELTQEQKAAIWDMIGSTAASPSSVSSSAGASSSANAVVPIDYVLYSFSVSIDSLTLDVYELDSSAVTVDTPSAAEKMIHLLQLHVHRWSSSVKVRPIRSSEQSGKNDTSSTRHPFDITITLDAFELNDTISSSSGSWSRTMLQNDTLLEDGILSASTVASSKVLEPFFSFSYNRDPSDGKADHRVRVTLKSAKMILVPECLVRIARILPSNVAARQNTAMSSISSSAAAGPSVPALLDLASSVSYDMQHEFVSSLTRRRIWDVALTTERWRLIIPAKPVQNEEAAASIHLSDNPLLVLSTDAISLTTNTSSLSDSSSGDDPIVLRRQLPTALIEHPNAFRKFDLNVQNVQACLWRSKFIMDEADEAGEVVAGGKGEPSVPSNDRVVILAPMSIHLSLHLCTKLRKMDVHGRPLLLPRAVLSGFLPTVRLSMTQSVLVFAATFSNHLRLTVQQTKMEERFLIRDSALALQSPSPALETPGKSSPPPRDDNPASSVPSESPPLPLPVLPAVRTQFHGYFGIGTAAMTIYDSSQSSSLSGSSYRPILNLRGEGCSTLFLASSQESNIRLGCEAVMVEAWNDHNSDRVGQTPVLIGSITSKHLASAPGGADAKTSLLRSPSVVVKADAEALQLRIITLLGAALRTTPPAYLTRPPSKQFIDAGISCIQVQWHPEVMLHMLRWMDSIPWPKLNTIVTPVAVPANAKAEPSDEADSSKTSIPHPASNASSPFLTPRTHEHDLDRFLALLTARIEEFSFVCYAVPTASASTSSPFVQVSLHELYLKQGVYARKAHTASPIDHLVVAGIRELVVRDMTPLGSVYPELLKCHVEAGEGSVVDPLEQELEDAFGEDEDQVEEHKVEQPVVDTCFQSLIPAHRVLLPQVPFPLLFTLDASTESSARYTGLESEARLSIRGVQAVYIRERLDQLIHYGSTGALAALSSSSQQIVSRVGQAWNATPKQSLHISALHPTIIIPRSLNMAHRGQHIQVDLGHIRVDVDSRIQHGMPRPIENEPHTLSPPPPTDKIEESKQVGLEELKVDLDEDESNPSSHRSSRSSSQTSDSTDSSDDSEHPTTDVWPAHRFLGAKSVHMIALRVSNMNVTCPLGAAIEPATASGEGVFFPSFSPPDAIRPKIHHLTPIVHELHFELALCVTLPVGSPQSDHGSVHSFEPHVEVRGRLNDIVAKVSRLQYLLLQHIAFENLFVGMDQTNSGPNALRSTLLAPVLESKEQEESKEISQAGPPASLAFPPPATSNMTVDVRVELDRLRVELLAESSSSSSLQSFAAFVVESMTIHHRQSLPHGINVAITTRKMKLLDCREAQQERTIFYPLPTEAADQSANISTDRDELWLTWSRSGVSPTSPISPSAPPRPDRFTAVCSNPCMLILPGFWTKFLEFVGREELDEIQTNETMTEDTNAETNDTWQERITPADDEEERKADHTTRGISSSPAISPSPPVGFVQKLYWLDMHVSINNARAVLPQSDATDAPAIVVTCDMHMTSSNTFPSHDSQVRNPSSASRTQEVELVLVHLQTFGGTSDRPLVSSLAHRLCACSNVSTTLHSTFQNVSTEDDEPAGPPKATTTAAINLDPVAMQVSYTDMVRLHTIISYFQSELRSAIKAKQDRLAKLPRATRPSTLDRRTSSRRIDHDWSSMEAEQNKQIILNQQEKFADNICIIVPQLLNEHEEEATQDATEEIVVPSTTSAPVISFGWFQLVELHCSSLSFIFMNDLTPSSAVPTGPIGAASVPVCHFCLFDCSLLWSHPRAHSQAASAASTDMVVVSVKTQLSLTAYDPANVEWINVVDQCAYEAAMEWQTSRVARQTRKGSHRQSSVATPHVDSRQSINIQLSSTQPQEVHISDRLLATLMELHQTFVIDTEKDQTSIKTRTSSVGSSSSSSTSVAVASSTRSTFFSPFILRNTLRSTLRATLISKGQPEVTSIIQPGEERPIASRAVAEAKNGAGIGRVGPWTYCSFEFTGNVAMAGGAVGEEVPSPFKPLLHVPVSKIGVLVYELQLASTGMPSGTFVQIVVSMSRAAKRIELKSMHSVSNSTSLPLELRLLPRLNVPGCPPSLVESIDLGTIEPGATVFLPLDEPTFQWEEVQFRPSGFGMKWNGAGAKDMSGQLTRTTAMKTERSVVVAVCKMDGLDEPPSSAPGAAAAPALDQGHIPSFVCQSVLRHSKHMASMIVPPTGSTLTTPEVEGIMTYYRTHIDLHPPLSITNLFLCDMTYQLKYRAVGAELLAAGILRPGDRVWVHDVELRLVPLIRFQLSFPNSNAVGTPKQMWSDWVGMEQATARPIVEYTVQVQQPSPAPAVPLLTQIHRAMHQSTGGAVSLTFLCPYWLSNQSGLPLAFTQADEMWENERFIFFKWRSPSLPTDRPQWSDRNGAPVKFPPPSASGGGAGGPPSSPEFEWMHEHGWTVEIISGTTDDLGWQYSMDFPGPYRNANSALDAVRRRKWFRHRSLRPIVPTSQPDASIAASPAALSGSSSSVPSGDDPASVLRNVRMYGAPFNSNPSFSVFAVGSVMPPSLPIDISRAATDTILVLAAPRSHRAPGNAVPSFELAVHVDRGPTPFSKVKVLSFHPRYLVHNETPLPLKLRQIALDPRNAKFVSSLQPGAIEPFHPWICTPPVGHPPNNRFGVHIGLDVAGGTVWSVAFPIQRIGEFTVRLPVVPSAVPDGEGNFAPAAYFRVKVELLRAVLHVHVLPESSFLNQPSALHMPDTNGQAFRTGGMYRVDNHTVHKIHVQQLAPGGKPDTYKRSSSAVSLFGFSSAPYAFEYLDLTVNASNDEQVKPPSHSVFVEVERTFSEMEQLQQMERDFNCLSGAGAAAAPLFTLIGLDDVGAESWVKLPGTYTVTPSDPSAGIVGYVSCRALYFSIATDGPTRVLVVREVDFTEMTDEDEDANRRIVKDQEEDGEDDPSNAHVNISFSFHLHEVNIVFFAVGDLVPILATKPVSSSSPAPARSTVQKVVRHGADLTKKWRGTSSTASTADAKSAASHAHIREVAFVQLLGLDVLGTWTSEGVTQVQVKLMKYQLDNPLKTPIFPVVLHSIAGIGDGSSSSANGGPPALLFFIRLPRQPISTSSVNGVTTSPFVVDRLFLSTSPFRLSLDEDFMRQAAAFVDGVTKRRGISSMSSAAPSATNSRLLATQKEIGRSQADMGELLRFLLAAPDSANTTAPKQQNILARMYYFRRFELGSVRLRLSYTPSTFVPSPGMSTDPLKPFHAMLGSARPFLDCEDAPVMFSGWTRGKLFTSLTRLKREIEKTYSTELVSQAIELLGRAKAFGNPLGLFSAVKSGWNDLVHDPNLSRGVKSFANHTAEGLGGGAAGVTSSLGSKVAKLSSDSAYLDQRRQHLQHDRPTTAKQGLESGGKHFAAGLVDGLTGLVAHPVAGAKAGGVKGAFKGVAKGLLGFATKPLAGALDGVAQLSAGIKSQAASGSPAGVQKIDRTSNAASLAASHTSPPPPPMQPTSLVSPVASPTNPSTPSHASGASGMWRCASCSCFNTATPQCIMCGESRNDATK